jgi:HEAT repeat protein
MTSRSFVRTAVVWLLASTVVVVAAPCGAQSIFSSPTDSAMNSAGSGIQDRYNRAKKGTNINEWVRRLADDDPETRLEAVKSLGDSGEAKANEYLMQAVGDSDQRIQAKAVEYLGKTRATDSTQFLIQRLFMAGTPSALRHRILYALGRIGDPKASRPILEYISDRVPPDIRGTGIFALGEIGDGSVRQDLERLRETEDDPNLARLIDEAVGKIALKQAEPVKEAGPFPSALEAALHPEPNR